MGLFAGALVACSSDADPPVYNTGGGGSTGKGGGSTGGSAGSTATAGTGGSTATAGNGGSGGSATGGGGSGGTGVTAGTGGGGGSGGTGGSGGSGGGSSDPTAVATIAGVNGQTVTGTATFTQGATMTTLVLNLTACPDGDLVSHLHLNPSCGDNGNAAGGHWTPNGEGIDDYTCAGGTATLNFAKPTSEWTVGGDPGTDVTQFAFMVHEGTTDAPGDRWGCGVVMATQ